MAFEITAERLAIGEATEQMALYDGYGPLDISRVVQHVFGRLVQLAAPTVRHYHSDFWHDAEWLRGIVKGTELVFYFAFDDCGTSIGVEPGCLATRAGGRHRVTVRVSTGERSGRYTVTTEPVEIV